MAFTCLSSVFKLAELFCISNYAIWYKDDKVKERINMVPLYIHLTCSEFLHIYGKRKSLTIAKAASIIKVSPGTIKNYEYDIIFP